MPSTIRDLNELTTPANNDFMLVSDTSDVTDRDKKMLLGKVPFKNGTPVAGRVASWTDADQVQDGGFAASDVDRLSIAQTMAALKTFSAGIQLGANQTIHMGNAGNNTFSHNNSYYLFTGPIAISNRLVAMGVLSFGPNTFTTLTPPSTSGIIIAYPLSTGSGAGGGIAGFTPSPECAKYGGGTNFATNTIALNGSTGAANFVTVSYTGALLYIENRIPFGLSLGYMILG